MQINIRNAHTHTHTQVSSFAKMIVIDSFCNFKNKVAQKETRINRKSNKMDYITYISSQKFVILMTYKSQSYSASTTTCINYNVFALCNLCK